MQLCCGLAAAMYSLHLTGSVSRLTVLDLSTACNPTDHCILLNSLQHLYGTSGTTLSWLSFYLTNRTQTAIAYDHSGTYRKFIDLPRVSNMALCWAQSSLSSTQNLFLTWFSAIPSSLSLLQTRPTSRLYPFTEYLTFNNFSGNPFLRYPNADAEK